MGSAVNAVVAVAVCSCLSECGGDVNDDFEVIFEDAMRFCCCCRFVFCVERIVLDG